MVAVSPVIFVMLQFLIVLHFSFALNF